MKTPNKDYQQNKKPEGEQKIIIDEKETGETDELDPKFEDQEPEKYEPGDDEKTALI